MNPVLQSIQRVFHLIMLVFALTLLLPVQTGWSKEAIPVAEDPELEKRMIELSQDLRCLVCQNESLAGSRSDFANDLRREIREQLKAEKSNQEIIDFLVARYGDFVLYKPPVKSTTYFLWAGPFVFLLVGAIILYTYLKRRRKQIDDPVLSDQQRQQAEALLSDHKGNNV